jgi:XTP/dITP diphosphohydrolase
MGLFLHSYERIENRERTITRVLYIASNNLHKAQELQTLLGPGWELRLARDLDPDIEWDESGSTFESNARIKARTVRELTRAAVLADDSGLEVDGLGGEPGVRSARYAGIDGDTAANNAKLQRAVEPLTDSQLGARFVCVLSYIDETGAEHVFRGECKGRIVRTPRGRHGFGYDPYFVPEGHDRTLAELSESEKNALSHRARAVAHFLSFLRASFS